MFVARSTLRGFAIVLLPVLVGCGEQTASEAQPSPAGGVGPAAVAGAPMAAGRAPTNPDDADPEVSRPAFWQYESGVLTFLTPASWDAGGDGPRVGVDVPAGKWEAETAQGCTWVVHHADFNDEGVDTSTVRLRGGTRFKAGLACGRWRLVEPSAEADPVSDR